MKPNEIPKYKSFEFIKENFSFNVGNEVQCDFLPYQ